MIRFAVLKDGLQGIMSAVRGPVRRKCSGPSKKGLEYRQSQQWEKRGIDNSETALKRQIGMDGFVQKMIQNQSANETSLDTSILQLHHCS